MRHAHSQNALLVFVALAALFLMPGQGLRAGTVASQHFSKFSNEFWDMEDVFGYHNFSQRPQWSLDFWKRQWKSQFENLLDRAMQGDADAQLRVAVHYDEGYGVRRDYSEAERWFLKVAEHGDADAQFLLGRFCYRAGRTSGDFSSEYWYRKAAESGHALAKYMLVLTLENNASSWGETIGGKQEREAVRLLTEICSFAPTQLADELDRLRRRLPGGSSAGGQGRQDCVSKAKRLLGYSNYLLGCHYEYGCGVTPDIGRSAEHYKVAAAYGNYDAQYCLGVCHALGRGVEQSYPMAVQLFRKLAGHSRLGKGAQCNLGFCYKNGKGVKRDYGRATDWYRKAADRPCDESVQKDEGDPMAQYQLGLCYEYGLGVPQNGARAFYWYERALKTRVPDETFFDLNLYHLMPVDSRGNRSMNENMWKRRMRSLVQCKIADCYARGVGVGKDLKEAMRLYQFVGDDDPEALCRIGQLYAQGGEGVERNPVKAVRFFRSAARRNHREAQYNLGHCYENGLGTRPDDKTAMFWYTQSADNGDVDAQYKVAKYHQSVSGDAEKAASYFAKAAKQGHAESQYELGVCYRDGRGMAKDIGKARKWFGLAAKHNNKDAAAALEELGMPEPAQRK